MDDRGMIACAVIIIPIMIMLWGFSSWNFFMKLVISVASVGITYWIVEQQSG